MNYQDLEKRINKAIDVREKGNLKKSRDLFQNLLADFKKLLKKNSSKKLKYLYATVMGEYVIQYRLEARDLKHKALDLGRELLAYDKKNKLNNPLSIRSVSNTLLNIGGYEEAEKYLRQLIKLYEDNENSGRKGDTQAHLAYVYLRTARLEEGKSLVDEAISNIKRNTKEEPHLSIWLSHALMVKTLIYNAEEKVDKAMKFAKEALEVAKEDNRVFRIKQAEELINYLEKK